MNLMRELEVQIDTTLAEIVAAEQIQNAKIHNKNGNSKGDGYVGIVETINITGDNTNLSLIVKTATLNAQVRIHVPIKQSFTTEIYFYKEIVPVFEKFGCHVAPKCYHASDGNYTELLVLENLKVQGYELWNRKQPFDKEHTEIMMRGYGKLHACSLHLKEVNLKLFNTFANELGDNVTNWMQIGKMFEGCAILCERSKDLIDPVAEKNVFEAYSRMCGDLKKIMLDYDYRKDPFAVITHGDCWSNNMLFQYQTTNDKKTLKNMKLVDFQLCRAASMICDITHFLFTCTGEEILRDLEYYLTVYHTSLSEQLIRMGSDPTIILPFDVLKEEFKKHCKYGLIISAFFLRVMLIEGDEAPDAQKAQNGDFIKMFTEEIKYEAVYKEKFAYLIRFFLF